MGAASSSSDPTAKFANSGTGPAARFQVVSGIPFTVSSNTKVPHLNADRLDSLDSTDFLRADGTAVRADASNSTGRGRCTSGARRI